MTIHLLDYLFMTYLFFVRRVSRKSKRLELSTLVCYSFDLVLRRFKIYIILNICMYIGNFDLQAFLLFIIFVFITDQQNLHAHTKYTYIYTCTRTIFTNNEQKSILNCFKNLKKHLSETHRYYHIIDVNMISVHTHTCQYNNTI